VVRRFQGRAFFDLTSIQWAFYDCFGVMPADTVKSIGGSQPEIAVPPDPLKGPQGRSRSNGGLAAAVEDLELFRQSAICSVAKAHEVASPRIHFKLTRA
jgi:hypothetical protein